MLEGTRNRRTLYVCGTDEYGTATEMQALKEKITPKQLCDKYNALHRETYDWFEISCVALLLICKFILMTIVMHRFDHFGRTSTPQHSEYVSKVAPPLLAHIS